LIARALHVPWREVDGLAAMAAGDEDLIPVRVGTDSPVTWRDAEPSGAVAA
jgi:hypothetical protein